ncbi:hypothetical protein BASA82_000610 [Batrachochytrium salamandrivorans]|nr:hypothetical protein BASA82_000610 [Batrachochytrium salamandrivorans]
MNFAKQVLDSGMEGHLPQPGEWVEVQYTCKLPSSPQAIVFPRVQFTLGTDSAQLPLLPALYACVEGMAVGEKSRFLVPFQHAYGELGCSPHIPPSTDLEIEVELIKITSTAKERAEQEAKESEAKLTSAMQLQLARKHPQACVALEEILLGKRKDEEGETLQVKFLAAMSYFEVGDYGKTVALLNQVLLPLGPKPNEPQARLRRAEAHICMLHSLVEAQTDLAWVKQHSPYLAQEAVGLEAKLKLATAARDRPLYSSSFVPMPQFTKLDEHVNTTKVYLTLSNGLRIELELFSDTHPKTCQLFTKLCELRQGEGGYCGTKIRVVECGFGIQGGQRVVGKFTEENMQVCNSHTPDSFLVCAANPNHSVEFFISTSAKPQPHLNGRFVSFGRVVVGQELLRRVEQEVAVAECGVVSQV